MAITKISLNANQPFDFASVIESHGWVDLLPNVFDAEKKSFSRIDELPSGKVVQTEINCEQGHGSGTINIGIRHKNKLSQADIKAVKENTRHMLRMDEDFTEFHALCDQKGQPWSCMGEGKGRLLRSPDLFEDIVKVICTTNIQWGGTRRMVRELASVYGKPFPFEPELKAFPRPEVIAAVPFAEFQNSLRLGYRASYIHTLSVEMAENPAAFHALLDRGQSTAEIKKKLLTIKGVGNYAAASILMLLGRYDEIPVDTVFQQLMREKYYKNKDFDLPNAISIYDDWGKWKYLAYWFDLFDFYHSSWR